MRSWLTREIGGAPYWVLLCSPFFIALCVLIIVQAQSRPQPAQPGADSDASSASDSRALPDEPKLLILGDSYTQGFAASPLKKGFAYLVAEQLGWRADIQGVGGTGFTYGGDNGEHADYGTRIKAYISDSTFSPDVIVLEGSQNDYRSVSTITKTVVADVSLLQKAYPKASIVLFGPAAPQPLQSQLGAIDAADDAAAAQLGIPYISPYQEGWLTDANTKEYGYKDGAHLNTRGHAFLAERFLADFKPLFGL